MKSLQTIACLAVLALVAMPAFAASNPDVPMPDPVAAVAPTEVAPGAPDHVCMFAIVEDFETCSIGLAAVAGSCPAILARVIDAMGPAVGRTGFMAACAAPAATPPPD